MNVIESFNTLSGYSRAREILFERPVQNSKTTVLTCANTISLYSTRSIPHQGIAPVKSSGLALVATIRINAFRKSVVLNEHAFSECTALVAEHVNSHKYLLAETLSLVVKSPA